MSVLRPITPADHGFVLGLNEANVELLAPLDETRLRELLTWSDLAHIVSGPGVDSDSGPVGFVITMGSGTSYDSPNYRDFAARFDSYYYLDRIVLAASTRRTGLGSRVYDEVEARAAQTAPRLCLEVNLDPPNEPSLAFHRGRGYVEVGTTQSNGHTVVLMEKQLG